MAKAWVGGKKLAYFSLISAEMPGLGRKQRTSETMQRATKNLMM
jgi:hypothetical protein